MRWHELPSFAIFRDPVERFISAYNYLVGGGNGGSSDLLTSQMLQSITFDSFLDQLCLASGRQNHMQDDGINDAANHKDASVCDSCGCTEKSSWKELPFHFWPQTTFLCDPETGDVRVDYLFRREHLNEALDK